MGKRQNRRPQASKRVREIQELRRSNAAGPIPSGKRYRRPSPGTRWE